MMWTPSDRAMKRVADERGAFERLLSFLDGDEQTAYSAAGFNTPLWQRFVKDAKITLDPTTEPSDT